VPVFDLCSITPWLKYSIGYRLEFSVEMELAREFLEYVNFKY